MLTMLKISRTEDTTGVALDIEGRLAGPWVAELEQCWHREEMRATGKPLSVRLSAVTFIDDSGKQLLAQMADHGANIQGNGCMIRAIVAGIISRCKAIAHPEAKFSSDSAIEESLEAKKKQEVK
jgi:anti-anti-sigma regulatory factor